MKTQVIYGNHASSLAVLLHQRLRLIFILLLLAYLPLVAAGQVKQWDKTVGSNNYDFLQTLQQTSDGGYILGGYTTFSGISGDKTEETRGGYDIWVVKLNASGQIEWDKTFGGSDDDDLFSLQQTTDGGYILGGSSYSDAGGDKTENSKGSSDFWVLKLNAAGEKEWDKTFGGSSSDGLNSLQQTSDGGYILGGSSGSPNDGDKTEMSRGITDYWVVKLNAAGEKQWDRTYGGSAIDELTSLQQTSDGGYILGGYSYSNVSVDKSEPSRGGADYWVVKIDAAGQKLWDRTYGGSNDDALASLQQTSDGGYILGGYSNSGISGDKTEASRGGNDYWVVKLSAAGEKQWDSTYGGSGEDVFYSLSQTFDGGYILGGRSSSGSSGDRTEAVIGSCQEGFCPDDYWVVKLYPDGSKEWDEAFGGNSSDVLTSLEQTLDGGYILGGYSSSDVSGDKTEPSRGRDDYWVVKLQGVTTCTPPEPVITLIPTSATYTGGNPAHLYLGYGPASVILQASGAESFTWSPASGLSSTTMADPVFTPTAPGSYTFTVTAANGTCTATASVTITVTDVRCGNKNNKVLVCHNGNPICIAPAAVNAHLVQHPEDVLGHCAAQPQAKKAPDANQSLVKVQAFPNPFTTRTAIAFTVPQTQEYTLQIFDLSGNLIQQWASAKAKAGSWEQVNWEPKRPGGGIYIVRLTTQHGVQHLRLIRE